MNSRDTRHAALRRRARKWAQRLNVRPRVVRISPMTRKWGLLLHSWDRHVGDRSGDQNPGFQDFVIAHEMLHLRVPNHGKLFKALMTAHVPAWRTYDLQRRRRTCVDPRMNPQDPGL